MSKKTPKPELDNQLDGKMDLQIENFRANFISSKGHSSLSLPRVFHLNNAGLAPISRPAREAVEYWIRRFYEDGMHCNDDYLAAIEIARNELALLLGADSGEIAFFQSTAGAISQMAFGIDLKNGDEVLMWDQEYASNLYPWKTACDRAGATLKLAASGANYETPVDQLLKLVNEKTRVIAISWVQYQTGAITDLRALSDFARSRNILTVVDVIQGVGLMPIHFHDSGIDAFCGGSHKWLCSPVGVGYLCLRKELVHNLKPLMVGALTYGTCEDKADFCTSPKRDATRFESGSKQVLEIVAIGASARLLRETGVELICSHVENLSLQLSEGLREYGYAISSPHAMGGAPKQCGSIVNFSEGTTGLTLSSIEERLSANRVPFARRGPGLRLSPHGFNTTEEIFQVLEILRPWTE
jgi:selenocysteine lyase/cysteine desulfurase